MQFPSEKQKMQGSKLTVVAVAVLLIAAVLLPKVSAVRYVVGGNKGWATNVNYPKWSRSKHLYNGDWLYFVYDRNRMNVLEVSKNDYERCIARRPLHNWTTGVGRDAVPLNVTKTYYFVSGKGQCYKGMRVAIRVQTPPHHRL